MWNLLEQLVEVQNRRDLAAEIEQRRDQFLLGGGSRSVRYRWVGIDVVGLRISVGHRGRLPDLTGLGSRSLGSELSIELYLQVPGTRPAVPVRLGLQMDITLPLDNSAIERILPHRYPFLLVDRITELVPDKRIVGIKNVTLNERYLAHPDGEPPVLPPTILTEAIAQVGAILILAKPENRQKLPYFRSIERVRYRAPVHPGDVVEIEATVVRLRSRVGVLKGIARVEGRVVVEGTMTFALGPRTGAPDAGE